MPKSIAQIEQQIITLLITKLLEHGYYVAVDDGGDELAQEPTRTASQVLRALFATGQDTLYVYPDACQEHGVYVPGTSEIVGFVELVYGNDGWDVISDYSVSLQDVMAQVEPLIESYQNG